MNNITVPEDSSRLKQHPTKSSWVRSNMQSQERGKEESLKAHWRNSVRSIKSLQHHLGREALPHVDNYDAPCATGTGLRPTLEELHLGNEMNSSKTGASTESGSTEGSPGGFKFGWIQGVLIRCLLNIWGVMLFLRLSWVVAQAGIGQAILIVLLATAITSLTAMSMSAISTNGQIKGGGTYFMISRSLGPEFGAAIGVVFATANATAVSLHTVGFCEALNDLLAELGVKIIDNGLNDIRIIGSITLVVLATIVVIGLEWEAKAQLLFLGILTVALANFIIGSILGPTSPDELSKGFVGYNAELLSTNFFPDYRVFNGIQQNFFSVFAIFFPAATGILAGANISGDLKDPSSAIPKGTILAIGITSLSYVVFAVIAGASVLRDATGNPLDYENGTISSYMNLCAIFDYNCSWGLHNSFQVMTLVSAFGPLNYAGCFAATLSSALACFVSAPKVFQALCNDRLFPYLHVFAKGYGKNNEPIRAYALTFVIALACVLIAQLNVIAPLITNCYLASYVLVNVSTFHVDLIQPVSWRPTFKYFNKWLSLIGSCLSFAAMFLCSWPTALITSALILILFLIVKQRKPEVNWGSSGQAQTYKAALVTVHQLNTNEEHVKTYTPQILVMTGAPNMRPSLVDFTYLICKKNSLMVCGEIVTERLTYQQRVRKITSATRWLRLQKIKSFYNLLDNIKFSEGVGAMLQTTGIGRMRPNVLLVGYQSEWKTGSVKQIDEYFTAIHTALEMHVAVAILRVQEGLDYTGILANFDSYETNSNNQTVHESGISKSGIENPAFVEDIEYDTKSYDFDGLPEMGLSEQTDKTAEDEPNENHDKELEISNVKASKKSRVPLKDLQGNELPMDMQDKIYRFRAKQKKGTIDVWWLYDDGGLSMLLPHILTTRSTWASSKLRVFCLADEKEHQTKRESMKLLLSKFRIPVSDVVVIPDITKPPSDATKSWFDGMTHNLVSLDSDPAIQSPTHTPIIKASELMAQKSKTFNYMRLRELLLQFSANANLVVLTLPLPRKGTISGPLYMAWLETLTANMPPFLLVRGNQKSVLTFYC